MCVRMFLALLRSSNLTAQSVRGHFFIRISAPFSWGTGIGLPMTTDPRCKISGLSSSAYVRIASESSSSATSTYTTDDGCATLLKEIPRSGSAFGASAVKTASNKWSRNLREGTIFLILFSRMCRHS